MLQNAMEEGRKTNTWDPVLAKRNKCERKERKAALARAKQQAELERIENERMRVKEFCEDMYRREALKCYGSCPGERTFTDDWSFWHGFDVTADTKAYGKSDAMRRAKHGQGCGGSLEWIAILRERRSRINRRIAEKKSVCQAKGNTDRDAPKKSLL